jgi:hypothetical protein
MPLKLVYKITYPNGKIYIGKDLTGSFNYFGSASGKLLQVDFPNAHDGEFVVRKVVLWRSDTATDAEVAAREVELIREHRSNDPAIGYNRWPQLKSS